MGVPYAQRHERGECSGAGVVSALRGTARETIRGPVTQELRDLFKELNVRNGRFTFASLRTFLQSHEKERWEVRANLQLMPDLTPAEGVGEKSAPSKSLKGSRTTLMVRTGAMTKADRQRGKEQGVEDKQVKQGRDMMRRASTAPSTRQRLLSFGDSLREQAIAAVKVASEVSAKATHAEEARRAKVMAIHSQ